MQKMLQKISEFQKHFPKKTSKIKMFASKKQQNQEFKTQERRKNKTDPFFEKQNKNFGQIILILTISNQYLTKSQNKDKFGFEYERLRDSEVEDPTLNSRSKNLEIPTI